ncbi:MAG TPA: hypothetical protein VG317_07365 [Pseudonocardiaceae bacterium]|jgi:hypothetical protein|nr:hypothetical protein [Pseudonocardiaceae bacterium]
MIAAIVVIAAGSLWSARRIEQAAERETREHFRRQLAELAEDDDDWPDDD